MSNYITIHGHFYQPPRENPWLEAIEVQDSAYPWHDWNERITAECYRPNATSRIIGSTGAISRIVNNYSRMSFNFGPTLLEWLEKEAHDVYQAILSADSESRTRFGGHGSAIAQVYNHIIMPLASYRDKVTQVVWGIEDFRFRFKREPEGMWLAEAAVDTETLEVLANHGIKYTVLAPRQAARVREIRLSATPGSTPASQFEPASDWHDVHGEWIDTRKAYLCRLPSGKTISLFFYNGGLARAVAFEGLLKDGSKFADYLLAGVDAHNPSPQLSHIATDGETYGHHHRFGDMALAFALQKIENTPSYHLTNYGQFLELHPPEMEVEIEERTSWSCEHGVERWRNDCGCNNGEHAGWHQKWRAPLRESFDWLRDELGKRFEERAGKHFQDPWRARDRYIEVILDRSPASLSSFYERELLPGVSAASQTEAKTLMEVQRNLLLMYTSCGWFFDDIGRIETAQDLTYAGRAIQLAETIFNESFESRFLARLEFAQGNKPALADGKAVFRTFVTPARVDQQKLAAHFALTGMFGDQTDPVVIYQYEVRKLDGRVLEAGHAKLSYGFIDVRSRMTGRTSQVYFGAVHFGDHNLACGVNFWKSKDVYEKAVADLSEAFGKADLPEVVRRLDRHFGDNIYTLKSLFKDGQRKLLKKLLKQTLYDAERRYRDIYEAHSPLMRFLEDVGAPIPKAFITAAEFIVNGDLKRAVSSVELDVGQIHNLLEEAVRWSLPLDLSGLNYKLTKTTDYLAAEWESNPNDSKAFDRLEAAVMLSNETVLDIDLWNARNSCFRVIHSPARPTKVEWTQKVQRLADALGVEF